MRVNKIAARNEKRLVDGRSLAPTAIYAVPEIPDPPFKTRVTVISSGVRVFREIDHCPGSNCLVHSSISDTPLFLHRGKHTRLLFRSH